MVLRETERRSAKYSDLSQQPSETCFVCALWNILQSPFSPSGTGRRQLATCVLLHIAGISQAVKGWHVGEAGGETPMSKELRLDGEVLFVAVEARPLPLA